MEMERVTAKLARISQGLSTSPSTCTRTNRVEMVWLTECKRYFTSSELNGIANSQPHRPKSAPSARNRLNSRRDEAPTARRMANSRRREAAFKATRL